ncbi:KIAA1109 (predicted) [Pycnogonum litorale]
MSGIDIARNSGGAAEDISVNDVRPNKVSAEPWNTTLNYDLENLPLDSNFAWLLCALLFAMTWVIYITYYNSRVIGYLLTKVVNRFVMPTSTYVKIGSISLSVLSGKVIFRDIIYMTMDYTVRIQDGWLIFHWWRSYVPKELSEDLSHSDTRLSVMLNGFEFHMYNRTEVYARLEKLFGLEPKLSKSVPERSDSDVSSSEEDLTSKSTYNYLDWHDLIPVIKIDISVGRVVFGNHLLPTTLSINFEEGHVMYTTKPAQSKLDLFTHIVKCRAENAKVLLAPSPKYTGMTDDPPRYMGEGFVVLQSNLVDIYYYMDEPGLVSAEPEMVQLANGDIIERPSSPLWGIDVKCGKGTDFSYGPWADRQREQLFKFFFPQDYQQVEVTKLPSAGEKRVVQSFDIRLSTLSDATIDILFSKEKMTNAIHINIGPGSYLESCLPWITTEDGYSTKINGQLLHVDGSTSLQYRSLLETETLEFDIVTKYPRRWNSHQDWRCSLTACKSTLSLIYAHKSFFQDMVTDWSSRARPDIYHFVPYTWHFNLIIKEFELITVANQHNWIDCSSQHQENAHVGFCGEVFDLSFDIPFVVFLPRTILMKFWIQAESVDLCLYIPEVNTCHNIVKNIDENAKLTSRDGSLLTGGISHSKKWRNLTEDWIDCWSVPILALSIAYTFHPMPQTRKSFGLKKNFTTPEKEEILLAPIRPDCSHGRYIVTPDDFDPTVLAPDGIHVELEVGPSVIKLYGSLLKYFVNIKDNYFGENQQFFDFDFVNDGKITKSNEMTDDANDNMENFDPRNYRPFEVSASITLHEIQGHMMKCCGDADPPCPSIYLERIAFEMHKSFRETKLQLLLSPLIVSSVDDVNRANGDQKNLNNGHLLLSGLQVKGHAMFSNEDRPLDSETLEYAWLVDVQAGDVTGQLSTTQLLHVSTGLETFLLLVEESGNDLHKPLSRVNCQHDIPKERCQESSNGEHDGPNQQYLCPSVEEIKYRMTRFSVNKINVHLVESNTSLNIVVYPLRFSTCNLHNKQCRNGMTFVIHNVMIKQFLKKTIGAQNQSSAEHRKDADLHLDENNQLWLEVGSMTLGPLLLETSLHQNFNALTSSSQNRFLKFHDAKTKRLWFLWSLDEILNFNVPTKVYGKCGCLGGCHFFCKKGSNWSQFFFESSSTSSDSMADTSRWPSLLRKDSSSEQTPHSLNPDHKHFFHANHGIIDENIIRNRKTGITISTEALGQTPGSSRSGSSVMRQSSCERHIQSDVHHGSLRPPSIHSELSDVSLTNRSKDSSKADVRASNGRLSDVVATCTGGVAAASRNSLISLQEKGTSKRSSISSIRLMERVASAESNSVHSLDAYYSADEENDANKKISSLPRTFKGEEAEGNVVVAESSSAQSLEDTKLLLDSEKHKVGATANVNGDESNHLSVDSNSTSASSTSFISAMSSQEDIAMVDLHTQMNKTITDSPLLMSCYSHHLSHVICSNWSSLPPLPQFSHRSSNAGHQPSFSYVSHGFTSIKMAEKSKLLSSHTSAGRTSTMSTPGYAETIPEFTPIIDFSGFFDTNSDNEKGFDEEEFNAASEVYSDVGKRRVILVKLLNDVDVHVCPIMLEMMQRFVDAITPALSRLHPLTIVNGLYLDCSGCVERQNVLKKELFYHPDKVKEVIRGNAANNQPPRNNKYDESRNQLTQAYVLVAKINICVMQTAIVEEVISFSALDNINDLTCPSILSVCLDTITMKLGSYQETHRAVQMYGQETPKESTIRRMNVPFRSISIRNQWATKKPKQDQTICEPFCVETVDKNIRNLVVSFNVDKVHAQIRRLCNTPNLIKDAILTVIPYQRSKVMFGLDGCGYVDRFSANSKNVNDNQIGFVMFECGLESIKFKFLKSSVGDKADEDLNDEILSKQNAKTRIEKESCDAFKPNVSDADRDSKVSAESDNVSWKSRISIPSQVPECGSLDGRVTADSVSHEARTLLDNSTSGVIKIKTVWFNFAAPPRTPNTRKIDFTRMDWHLLSTVSPGLNAWLNPCDHLKTSAEKMMNNLKIRRCAVLACLMIEALEKERIHIPLKRKYQRLTLLSNTIQEDPSCQLLVVLMRYMKEINGVSSVEKSLQESSLPHLNTFHRGLMALSRQWKNVLYVPILVEQNYRLKNNMRHHQTPMNVSFCPPGIMKGIDNSHLADEESIDETEASDENTRLLKTSQRGRTQNVIASNKQEELTSPESIDVATNESQQDLTRTAPSNGIFKAKKKLPSYIPRSSRATIAFPLFSIASETSSSKLTNVFNSLFSRSAAGFNRLLGSGYAASGSKQYQHVPLKGKQKDDSTYSVQSAGSWSEASYPVDTVVATQDVPSSSAGGTPHHRLTQIQDIEREYSTLDDCYDEDLYNWMAREQEKQIGDNNPRVTIVTGSQNVRESNVTTLTSERSRDELYGYQDQSMLLTPLTVQIADANIIFEPLLSRLSVLKTASRPAQNIGGTRISTCAGIEQVKVDIVESEFNSGTRKKKRQRRDGAGKLFCDTTADQAAFLCDKLNFELELREISDFEKSLTDENSSDRHGVKPIQQMMYDFGKKLTTVVNFDVNIHFVAQQVNMPLLRLLHQFSTMYQNVRETQHELKGKRLDKDGCHRKTESSSSESQTDSIMPHRHHHHHGHVHQNQQPAIHTTSIVGVCPKHKSYVSSTQIKANQLGNSPPSLDLSECIAIKMPNDMDQVDEGAEDAVSDDNKPSHHGNCWRTMYYLMDLYTTMPEMKTINNRSQVTTPLAEESIFEKFGLANKYEQLKEHCVNMDGLDGGNNQSANARHLSVTQNSIFQDHVVLVTFGLLKIRKMRLLATLSGLKLEAELENLHVSATHKEMSKYHPNVNTISKKRWFDSSVTGHLGRSMVVLLEGILPAQQTVVKITVGKSQALYSSTKKKRACKDRSSALLSIGPIQLDIPQHPVVLHGMMTRGTKQLSTTLQELRATASRQPNRNTRLDETNISESVHSPKSSQQSYHRSSYHRRHEDRSRPDGANVGAVPDPAHQRALIQPIVVQFTIILESFSVGAALLPSLTAKYQMGQITSSGVSGSKAKFTIDLPKHSLSFNTKVHSAETNLPSSAMVDLPPVHVSSEYIQDSSGRIDEQNLMEGVVLRQGSYLNAVAEIGSFEHSLTTDLLNHLVFVQKVFMKEVNEVVQKVSGADRPIFLWPEDEEVKQSTCQTSSSSTATLLFSLQLHLKGIQITAMTPTNSAVRFETGSVQLQLSNRVQNMSRVSMSSSHANFVKLFGKVQLDMNLSLGQLIKHAVFEEAEPEFQQFAYFKTRFIMRNALQDEMAASQSDDKEAVLITLNRPLIHVQPIALDKAILVWLNYKNAYEYWNEQRANLNKEVLTATQQVFEKVPPISQLTTSQTVGNLFLQLTIDDLGICLPLIAYSGVLGYNNSRMLDTELKSALVVTLDSTRISACSCRSLASKGRFTDLCLRFVDDFETSLDDWKPDTSDGTNMNLFVVSEGTYDICSQTIAPQASENVKWILNVQWQMEGVDIHVDTNIGKLLSSLFNTLTTLTGDDQNNEDDAANAGTSKDVDGNISFNRSAQMASDASTNAKATCQDTVLPLFVFDPIVDAKKRSRFIEKEMNEQAKVVNDLKLLGASQNTIEQELKRLQELESLVFNDFRRDMIKKLRRQSVKQATLVKGKLGLGSDSSPSHSRSKSIVIPQKYNMYSPSRELETIGSSSKESSPSVGHMRASSLDASLIVPRVTFGKVSSFHKTNNANDSGSSDVMRSTIYEPKSAASSTTSPTSESSINAEDAFVPDRKSTFASPGQHPKVQNPKLVDAASRPQSTESTTKQAKFEPSVDFALDINVFINSGKCVFHSKESSSMSTTTMMKDDEQINKRSLRKDRSYLGSSNFDFPLSPNHRKRGVLGMSGGGYMRTNLSTSRLKYLQLPQQSQQMDYSVFLIPGLDVKVHYKSKTDNVGDSTFVSGNESKQNSAPRKSGVKKASLYAWLTLQSIPEETVIAPHILDFLESALEPIPMPSFSVVNKQTNHNQTTSQDTNGSVFTKLDVDSANTSLSVPVQYVASSFPVDVIVYFRMQPSILRFSCLPTSRVECWLRLPSVDLVFSSKRGDEEPSCIKDQRSYSGTVPSNAVIGGLYTGGISVTACLADFSLHIFHPYGGGKKSAMTGGQKLFDPTTVGANGSGLESSPLADAERKDSLSLQVEFVKVNISRSRRLNPVCVTATDLQKNVDVPSMTFVNVSTIIDIGSASFKYDMRRLTEILAFPKAWYRKKIARRIFLGDESSGTVFSDQDDSGPDESRSTTSMLSPDASTKTTDLFVFPSSSSSSTPVSGAMPESEIKTPNLKSKSDKPSKTFHGSLEETANLRPPSIPKLPVSAPPTPVDHNIQRIAEEVVGVETSHCSGGATKPVWKTLLLFTVNLSKLNVHMNMGNVMGNTMWSTRGVRSEGNLSIGSSGHKNMMISLGLGGSSIDAKGGIVGGSFDVSVADTFVHIKEDPGQEPDHKVHLRLYALESRLDYMGTSVLMGRVSSLNFTMKGEWTVNTGPRKYQAFLPTKRPAFVFLHCNLNWDQLQLMISKSTNTDVIRMCHKLEEFFCQQFRSSKRVFSALQPNKRHSIKKKSPSVNNENATTNNEAPPPDPEVSHHRHWQHVLSYISGLKLAMLSTPLPLHGTIVGGTVDLRGDNISLACFHGINFRAKSWALFSLKEPNISFATEAQDITEHGNVDTHVIQNLSFSLGHSTSGEATVHSSMAKVCKISRTVIFPPQFRTMQEWFYYAFATSSLDDVGRFPSLERRDSLSSMDRRTSQSPKTPEHNHTMEIIFAFPSLQLQLKTEHLQTEKVPCLSDVDSKPTVMCSFVTEFDDHIFVAVDAEAFFFLHDLINSYLKEKERVLKTPQMQTSKVQSPVADKRCKAVKEPLHSLFEDWREFQCKTWHLEPTVRLLSWAGNRIDPYGVDYILQKLGFSHARVTIPKWMQRGFMDPLDKILSIIIFNMITTVKEQANDA